MRWAWRLVGWLVILAVVASVTPAVLVPRLGGGTPYTVLTGSMRPGLPPGTLVVTRPVETTELGVGDVITYQLNSGDAAVVTHRIVSQGLDADGEPVFRTQGDANNAPDENWVRPVQVMGEKWYSVPYLGYVSNGLTGTQRQNGIYLTAAGLMGYALLMLAGSAWDSRRRRSVAEPVHV